MAGMGVSVSEHAGQGTVINFGAGSERGGPPGGGGGPPPGHGACCVGHTCSITTAAACAAAGGTYQGDGTPCTPNPCVAYLITYSDVHFFGTFSETDCISFGGEASFDSNSFLAELPDVTNPCVGLGGACDGVGEDWATFEAVMNFDPSPTGIHQAQACVNSDLESGLTICSGDCEDDWCGYITCYVVVSVCPAIQEGSFGASWSNYEEAVAHGPYSVEIHIVADAVYGLFCGDCDVDNCWNLWVPDGETDHIDVTCTCTITVTHA